jgi:hypothetical protein
MLNWLTDNVAVFKIQHNAHLEFRTPVAQHLRLRERIGDAPFFLNAGDRTTCIEAETLWELRVILSDGTAFDLAGSSLENCICAAKSQMANMEMAA